MSTDVKFVEMPQYAIPTRSVTLNSFLSHYTTGSVLEHLIELLPKCTNEGPWIAGGALHRTYRKLTLTDSDVDVFFKNKEQLDKYLLDLNANALKTGKYSTKSYIVSDWHHTITISYMGTDFKIQCVSFKYFDNIDALFKSFDINVCRIAYDGVNIVMEENVLDEIHNNKLTFNRESINFPSVTLKRLIKYVKMGYNVEDDQLRVLTHAFYKSKKKAIDILDQDLMTKNATPINNYEGLK